MTSAVITIDEALTDPAATNREGRESQQLFDAPRTVHALARHRSGAARKPLLSAASSSKAQLDLACHADACHVSRYSRKEDAMWNWISAFGVLVELFGFGTLAYELWRTGQANIVDTVDLAGENTAFETVLISDGPDGRAEMEGGILGKQIAALRGSELKLRERMTLIIRGVVISAIGCLMQVVGSFGQALN